jgi:hypothetical protein
VFSDDSNKKKSVSATHYFSALSDSDKKARASSMLNANPNIAVGPYTKIKLANCSYCKNQFWSNNLNTREYNTTCSDECFLAVKRKNRAGSKTVYNNESYDSKWEVELAVWMDENNIEYQRPKTHIPWIDSLGKSRKYFPDFYLPNFDLFLDPKNKFCIASQQEKLDYVQSKINLVYGEVDCIKEYVKSLWNK